MNKQLFFSVMVLMWQQFYLDDHSGFAAMMVWVSIIALIYFTCEPRIGGRR